MSSHKRQKMATGCACPNNELGSTLTTEAEKQAMSITQLIYKDTACTTKLHRFVLHYVVPFLRFEEIIRWGSISKYHRVAFTGYPLDLSGVWIHADTLKPATCFMHSWSVSTIDVGTLSCALTESLPKTLKRLTARFSELKTLGCLSAHCPRLRYLDLTGTSIEDTTYLAQFEALETLSLAKTNVHTLEEIPPKIRSLRLDQCPIADISVSQLAPDLRELSLDSCPHFKTRHFSQLNPRLEKLSMRRCALKIVDGLPEMPKLHTLNLKRTGLVRLQPLTKLVSLTSLNISNNTRIEDFQALSGMISLTELGLSSCLVADMDFVRSLSFLEYLDVSKCPLLLSIGPLGECRNLKKLYASRTRITSLLGLENATSLEILDVAYCHHLKTLEYLPISSLICLTLSYTNINDIRCLTGAQSLSSLIMENMYQHKIDLSPLKTCPKLRKLDIRFCSFGLAPLILSKHVEVRSFIIVFFLMATSV